MGFIGVDLGSTNIKAALYDRELNRLALIRRPARYDRAGARVEFDADAYADTVLEMLRELGTQGEPVEQVALTGQAESLVLLGEDLRPLRPAISWMDERSVDECAVLSDRFPAQTVRAATGQSAVLPTWPATKVLHLSRHEPELVARTAKYAMIKDYVALRLSGRLAADKSIATFSLWFDIHTGDYWQPMLDACGIRPDQLPPLVEPGTVLGALDPELGLGDAFAGATLNSGTLDHFAGMLGTGNIRPGVVSESTGTVLGICAMAPLPLSGRERAALHYGPFPGSYVLLPVAESGGVCLEWLHRTMLSDLSYPEIDRLCEERGPSELLFLPYLVGANAPEHDADARGVFWGLRAEHDRIDLARAVMEGVALLLDRNLRALRRDGVAVERVLSTGGGAKSDLWSQLKADFCGCEVAIPADQEVACLGAAMMGAVSAGAFPDFDRAASSAVRIAKRFAPRNDPRIARLRRGYDTLFRGMLDTARAMREA